MSINMPVFVAFDAGNLLPVAKRLRREYPGIGITIAADNDCWGTVNVGLTKGREAAAAIGAELIYPIFKGLDLSSKPSDFTIVIAWRFADGYRKENPVSIPNGFKCSDKGVIFIKEDKDGNKTDQPVTFKEIKVDSFVA